MALFGAHPAATPTPPRVDEIVLRRVHAATAADERHIGFHSDASARTMQVVLNDGAEYAGGRLVFLSAAGALVVAPRVAGSATVHDASIVHGVTTMRRGGVRYSLFLLQSVAVKRDE
jgi:predicted 2-oxoglutarate/Fe(II)-dependent dioxygenase YbiX